MERNRFQIRSRLLIGLLAVVVAIYAWVLFDLQVVNGGSWLEQSTKKIANTETVQSDRGDILDRYGRVLATNRATYQVTLDQSLMGDAQSRNAILLDLLRICREQGVSWSDSLTISLSPPFSYTTQTPFESITILEDGTERRSATQLKRLLDNLKLKGLAGAPDASALMEALRTYFNVDPTVPDREARALIGVLYELTLRSKDIARTNYVFAKDVEIGFITAVKEQGLAGVRIDTVTVRQYNTRYAAHILGQVGAIQNWDNYKDKGYSMTDIVGISGVELAFEELLRGTPGTKDVELSQSGKIISESWHLNEDTGEPQIPGPGDNIMLTIDIALQEVVEETLNRYVPDMTEKLAAACVVVDMTGGVLAAASYPTYDPAEYYTSYTTLSTDATKPLFNRALQGLYAPGSTFKMAVAAGALEEGAVTAREKILDTGRYTHYERLEDQPQCWYYREYGRTHGYENVAEAIRDSCNVYFYEVGLRLGIDKLDDYAALFGLGQKTGLELWEATGEVAGPATSAKYNQTWYEGETMYAAIGQGSTQVTPIQLANYVATLVNGGVHYPTHLLKTVKSSDFSQVLEEYYPEPLNVLELKPQNLEAIKNGMGMVVSEGTLARYFRGLEVTVGAKTGTAQVAGNETANAVLVAFAPYDEPEIAISIVVEQGASGSLIGAIAADIIEYYFSAKATMDAPARENTLVK